jgi:hypothetical protein
VKDKTVTLDADTVSALSGAMRRQSDTAANTLMRWAAELAEPQDGLRDVPDFVAMGIDFYVPVRRLRDAHKTYRNMTIRIVPTAASRSTYRDRKSSAAAS